MNIEKKLELKLSALYTMLGTKALLNPRSKSENELQQEIKSLVNLAYQTGYDSGYKDAEASKGDYIDKKIG